MVSDRPPRSRKADHGGPEVVNEKFDKEVSGEMGGFRKACQI